MMIGIDSCCPRAGRTVTFPATFRGVDRLTGRQIVVELLYTTARNPQKNRRRRSDGLNLQHLDTAPRHVLR